MNAHPLSDYDELHRIDVVRRGDAWTARVVTVDPPDRPTLSVETGVHGSPGEALEALALTLDAVEVERIVDADYAARDAALEEDEELARGELLERVWRQETGSRDPQGPPPGWRPRSRSRVEP